MFIVTATYKGELDEAERHLEAHSAYLDRYYALGQIVFSGRKSRPTGSFILFHGIQRFEVEQAIAEDPLHINDLATYEIAEVTPAKYDTRFEPFIRE